MVYPRISTMDENKQGSYINNNEEEGEKVKKKFNRAFSELI